MWPTSERRGLPRLTATVAAVSAIALAMSGLVLLGPATSASADGVCATPGGSGAGGTLTGVVNSYYPGVGTAAAGATSISVGAPTGAVTPIAAGDLLLVVQMQAADINSTNTNSYGHGPPAATPASGYTALNAAGLYEYVLATSGVSAGSVSITGLGTGAGLLNSYTSAVATGTAGQRTFQVIRVPQYTTATTSSTLTAAAWNGTTGGVLALDTTSTLTLNGTVSVDGLGFRGGVAFQRTGGAGLANPDVVTSSGAGANGNKAEGIAGTPSGTTTTNGYPGGDAARGAPANAGGGGTDGRPSANDENSGGGGGGNGAAGGQGGNTWNSTLDRGGYGGVVLPATSARVFMGGGGGAGTANNFAPPAAAGAPGGGMVLIRAGAVGGTGAITANGLAAYNLTQNDGGGGGGAGGTIVLTSLSGSLTGATLNASGGRGGNAWATQAGATSAHGPGGGGAGGWIFTSSAPTAISVAGGANGITTTGNLAYGATPGGTGQTATVAPSTIPGVSGGAECADVSITKSGPLTVAAGGAVAYQLTVANAGPAAAAGLSVVDTLPAGVTFVSASGTGWLCTNSGNVVTCTLASIASGTTASVITVNVTAQAQAGTMVNSATVTATTPDPVPANNTTTASTTVTARADLVITKTGPATVTAGANVTYSLVVQNLGPSDAVSLSVVDTLPAGVVFVSAAGAGWLCTSSGNASVSCTRPLLPTGTTAPDIVVVVTGPAQGTTLSNSATVSSTTPDPNLINNTSSVSTGVTASADLSVVKSGPASVVAGGLVSYSLVVANVGPSDASSVVVTDTLPAGVVFGSASGPGWLCTNNANVSVSCTQATYATGASTTITVVVTAPAQATTLSNTAAVSSTTADPVPGNNASAVSTTVTASANLALVKSGPASVVAGGSVSYSLVVSNLGPSDATTVSVVDTLPAGVVFGSASGPGWACGVSGGVVTCTRATFATGASNTITIVVTAPPQAVTLNNAASISSATPDPVPGNNASSVSTTVTASADLSVVKSGPPTVTASGLVTYSLVVGNVGPSDAAAVAVTDTLPAGVVFGSASGPGWSCTNDADVSVTCTRATYAAGASTTITLVVTAPAQAATLTNTVSVASTTSDPNLINNTSSVSTGVTASADLSVVKSGPASVVAGGLVSYSLVVANVGPSDASSVVVTDTLPAGVVFGSASGPGWLCTNNANVSVSCTQATYATGASTTITVVVTAPAQAGSLTNTAAVSSTTADPVPGNNASAVSTTVTASANLALVKSGPASVVAGGSVSYSLVVSNLGPSDATTVSVVDTLPAGVVFGSASGPGWACGVSGGVVTCTRATFATGASNTITIVVTAPPQAVTLNNAASISSATPDPVPGNNASSVSTTVTASADLSVVKSGPPTVTASGLVTYSLVVGNVGPSDAAAVAVTDTLPAGVVFGSASGPGWSCTNDADVSVTCTRATYAAGASTTITLVVTAPAQAATLTNTVSVASTTSDPNLINNTSSLTTDVGASADLSIVKSGPATVTAAESVSYDLAVVNLGPSDATTVSVVDTLPSGVVFVSAVGPGWACTHSGGVVTCTRATYASSASTTIAIMVTAPAQGGSLTNAATVSAVTPDPEPGNNVSSLVTTVTPSADLSVIKGAPATVTAAGSISYSLLVTNLGPSDASSVVVTDTLPAGVVFGSASGPGWTCGVSGGVVTCTRLTYATGASTTITIVVDAPAEAGTLLNSATVSAATPDPVLVNNTSDATTTVTASADLSLAKSGPATVAAGATITYSLAVDNAGPSTALAVVVTDTLPAGVSFGSASGTGWTCTNSGASVSCSRATLPVGPAPVITVVLQAPVQSASLTNSAAVTASTPDPDPGDNGDSVTTQVGAAADLSLVKTGPATVELGQNVTYVLAVRNAGPDDAVDVAVTDTLPAGVTFVSVTGSGWTCTNDADTSVTCLRPGVPDGGSAPDITVIVRAPATAGTLTNNAGVSAATFDPVDNNNASIASTEVLGQGIDGGGPLPGTGGHGLGIVWLGLLLVGIGTALRSVRGRSDRAL